MSDYPRNRDLKLITGDAENVEIEETTLRFPRPPVKFGPLQIIRRLGTGGLSEIYEAVDGATADHIAVKVMRPFRLLAGELEEEHIAMAGVGHLRHEYDSMQGIADKGLLAFKGFGEVNGVEYLAMELFSTGTLADVIHARRHGELLTDFQAIAVQICSALVTLHQAGRVHCDLKPANCLFDETRKTIKLCDFANVEKLEQGEPTVIPRSLSTTDRYASPEVRWKRPLDGRADIFSLGYTFYELLTGQMPFVERAKMSFSELKATPQTPDARRFNKHVTDEFAQLLIAMMENEPDNRPESMQEVLRAVQTMELVQ